MTRITQVQKANCILWMHELKCQVSVKRKFAIVYKSKYKPSSNQITKWYNDFKLKGQFGSLKRGRKCLPAEAVETVREHFESKPRSSIRQASRELRMPCSTIHKTLRKTLHFYPYKIMLVHAMKPQDGPARVAFAEKTLENNTADPSYLQRIFFSDEATFHVSGAVNRHNVRIWGVENPRE